MDSRSWPCPTCDDVAVFVQPPCADGHTEDGGLCPEWICVDCGAALLIGDVDTVSTVIRARAAA